jgi:hypothetical protein
MGDDLGDEFDSDSESPDELWASLTAAERDEVREQMDRRGESLASWLDAYLHGERLLQRDVAELDRLWLHADEARRELEWLLAEQVGADDGGGDRGGGLSAMFWLDSLNDWDMSPEDNHLLDLVCELCRLDRRRACREWHITHLRLPRSQQRQRRGPFLLGRASAR